MAKNELQANVKNELKGIILNYVLGEDPSVTKLLLQKKCADFNKSGRALYKSILIDPVNSDEFTLALLTSLNIHALTTSESSSDSTNPVAKINNVYDLLVYLAHNSQQEGYHQVSHLVGLIDETKPQRNGTIGFLVGVLVSAGLGAFLYSKKGVVEAIVLWIQHAFPLVIDWLRKTFSLLHNIPLLGIVYNTIVYGMYCYRLWVNDTATNKEKLTSLFFKTLAASLTITAYLLCYLAGGMLVFPAALLFVISSSIEVFKSAYYFYLSRRTMNKLTEPVDNTWEHWAKYKRAENLHQGYINSFWIRLTGALLTTATVIVWECFAPNPIVTISCICCMIFISLTKKSALTAFEEGNANQLQETLRHLGENTDMPLQPIWANYGKGKRAQDTAAELAQCKQEIAALENYLLPRLTPQGAVDLPENTNARMLSQNIVFNEERGKNVAELLGLHGTFKQPKVDVSTQTCELTTEPVAALTFN